MRAARCAASPPPFAACPRARLAGRSFPNVGGACDRCGARPPPAPTASAAPRGPVTAAGLVGSPWAPSRTHAAPSHAASVPASLSVHRATLPPGPGLLRPLLLHPGGLPASLTPPPPCGPRVQAWHLRSSPLPELGRAGHSPNPKPVPTLQAQCPPPRPPSIRTTPLPGLLTCPGGYLVFLVEFPLLPAQILPVPMPPPGSPPRHRSEPWQRDFLATAGSEAPERNGSSSSSLFSTAPGQALCTHPPSRLSGPCPHAHDRRLPVGPSPALRAQGSVVLPGPKTPLTTLAVHKPVPVSLTATGPSARRAAVPAAGGRGDPPD